MWMLGPIGFTAPILLGALAALPVLWLMMRAAPPPPRVLRFPGTALLEGLRDARPSLERTPLWLMILRMLAAAAVIAALAGPVWRPAAPAATSDAPLLIVMDAGWQAAGGFSAAQSRAVAAADQAGEAGRPVGLLMGDGLAQDEEGRAHPIAFAAGAEIAAQIRAARPRAWPGAYGSAPEAALEALDAPGAAGGGALETLWLADGIDHPGRAEWLAALSARGPVTVALPGAAPRALMMREGPVPALQSESLDPGDPPAIAVYGPDPQGVPRVLDRLVQGPAETAGGVTRRLTPINLPPELRNRVTRFEIEGAGSAGAVVLGDDALRRRKVGLIGAARAREAQPLLLGSHYLREALRERADLIEGAQGDILEARPDAVVLVDEPGVAADGDLARFVDEGGMLIRFAGPRMAADPRLEAEALLPVPLRPGGRDSGGALSWDQPRPIAPFDPAGPFAGLEIPEDVTVRAQLLAQPGPELGAAVIAQLSDGTPVVSRAAQGRGQVVLFHIGANAEWSNLPLSGLFIDMLARLIATAGAPLADTGPEGAPDAPYLVPELLLDGFGQPVPAADAAPIPAETAAFGPAPGFPAGLYRAGERHVAVNAGAPLIPATWEGAAVESAASAPRGRALGGWLLLAAAALLLLDAAGSALLLRGRPARRGGLAARGTAPAIALLAALALPGALDAAEPPPPPDPRLINAASEFALAYIETGVPEIDAISLAGLEGLRMILTERTTVEPSQTLGIDLETDDISVLSLLYWPITDSQPVPSPLAYQKLNRFLNSGGMIVLDTRDGDLAGTGTGGAQTDLRRLAGALDLPPLAEVPEDHVLTRAYYLLDDFPGRSLGTPVWVEAAADQGERPFAAANDGVSPVVIGGNSWAEAWAIDSRFMPRFDLRPGGEQQREMSYRFGVNLVMYVLTGNYKSDQIHIPTLLERLRIEGAGQ